MCTDKDGITMDGNRLQAELIVDHTITCLQLLFEGPCNPTSYENHGLAYAAIPCPTSLLVGSDKKGYRDENTQFHVLGCVKLELKVKRRRHQNILTHNNRRLTTQRNLNFQVL